MGDFEDEHANIHRKLDTVFAWAFGNDEDATDRGFAGDMDDQFDDLAEQLEEIQERLDDRHEEISRRIDDLINALHDEESLEFDRDDVD
ncbi:hypothetical protein C481_11005 [Natrialba asiatica DSM 12278]|uniref:Uncharacterized protein n=2 Tax=Natrialba asiatica TaxID=64602 RepID=M0AS30_NATA1|nr:hypothetical protein C481_11005 [Natrialba asiatica DSM 12278]